MKCKGESAPTLLLSLLLTTPWLVEQGGLMQHSQRHSNNPYPESNQPNSLY